VFVGHPIRETTAACEDLGKRLKRNNVAIDVINFANPDNVSKLEALVTACDNSSNSHFLDVPIGINMITDILFTSPILHGDEAGISATGGAAGGQFSEYGGINPGNDPELAMALKISLEEEKAKQKAQEPK
jgi:26S proteasome regulatory subunit N10